MSSRNLGRPATRGSDLRSYALNPDDSYSDSSSEGGATDRQTNDVRLQQAINYVSEQGGNDSPATFIDRVIRIDEALIRELPLKNPGKFDKKLHNVLQKLVEGIQREYQEAMEAASPLSEIEDALPEYDTPGATEALHRISSVVSLGSSAFEAPPRRPKPKFPVGRMTLKGTLGNEKPRTSADVVELEHQFKYGGPDNEIENWYRNMPASLPFPETLQMEHWESLKIDFDLSEYGKNLKSEGKFVETNIPFNHPALDQYKNLDHLESGSKFKLPVIDQHDYDKIKLLGNRSRLEKVVNAFNTGDREEELKKDYAPRLLLDQFEVGLQASPSAIRRSMNVTPTKPTRLRRTSSTPRVTPGTGTTARAPIRPGSSMRVFQRGLDESLRNSPHPESPPESVNPSPIVRKTPVPPVNPSADRHARGRSTIDPLYSISRKSRIEPSTTQPSTKRKRSLGSQVYTPDGKRQKSIGSEDYTPAKKTRRSSAGQTPKRVEFAGEITSGDESEIEMVVPRKASTAAKQNRMTEPVDEDNFD